MRRQVAAALASVAAGLAAIGLALPGAAVAAGAYQQVLRAYETSGTLAPCRFSAAQLQSALGGVDTYGAQYFADFTDAIQSALTSRAGGECNRATGSTSSAAAGGAASNAVARLPAVTAATSAGVPAPLIVLGALALVGAMAVLGGSVTAAQRRRRPSAEP
jgi:hypothetical protein